MHNPTQEDILLKVFNFNDCGAVLGVFHAKYGGGNAGPITGTVSLEDIPGLASGKYAVFAHQSGEVRVIGTGGKWPVQLKHNQWEIFTFTAVNNGHAILGLADKFNSGGAVTSLRHGKKQTSFRLRDAGILVMYSAEKPSSIRLENKPLAMQYNKKTGKVTVTVPAQGSLTVLWE